MYGTLSNIALAFIAVALLVVMVDQLTRVLQEILPFPQKYELPLIYVILVSIASVICWQGRFDLFAQLGFEWQHSELGWLLTGSIIAGGSSLLGKQFRMVGLIPGIVSGMASMFGWGSNSSTTTTNDEQNGSDMP